MSHAHTQPFVKSATGFDSKWDFHICDIPLVLLIDRASPQVSRWDTEGKMSVRRAECLCLEARQPGGGHHFSHGTTVSK